MVSIIVPMYNSAKWMEDCITSIKAQTHDGFECIIVNDCSTDESLEVAKELMDERFQIVDLDENVGYARAKNFGLGVAKGDYIVPLDSDDMLTTDSIEVRARHAEKRPNIDVFCGSVYDVEDEFMTYENCVASMDKLKKSKGTQRQFQKEHRLKPHAQGMMFKIDVFKKHGGYYDIVSKSDKELTYRLGIHPLSPIERKVSYVRFNDFVAFYRRRKSSMKSGLSDEQKQNLKKKFNRRIKALQELA